MCGPLLFTLKVRAYGKCTKYSPLPLKISFWVAYIKMDNFLIAPAYLEPEFKCKYWQTFLISKLFSVGVAPKSREDFQRLYADIEKWRNSKDNELKNNYSKDPKSLSKERAKLILEEAKQLIVIDQSKGKIRKDVHKESLVNSIIKAGKPKLWINGKGRLVKVETQDTLRAKELSDIYIKLSKTAHEGENDQRREALICLADIIGQLEQCSLTSEIIQLAEREEDLRIRGFKSHQIFGLMTRIGNLFLKLIKSPLHNPAIHQSLNNKLQLHLQPSDLSLISRELPIEYCKGCRKYLSKTSFGQAKEKKSSNKNGKQKLESKCLRCGRLDNDARTRQDLSIYKDMLNYIKKDEEHLNGFDSPVFKLKDSDIRQIVVNFWGSKSILSGLNDPYDLCLVRWDKTTHWSPWNCVLLSFEEGAIHSQLSNIKKVYKYFLIERVNYRHTLARIHFAKDPYLYSYVKNESKENKVESLSIKGDTIKPNNPNVFKL
nr:IQ and ubiquitin-like domain-containing protein [Lepeophtheirus salmonis]